MSGFAHIDPAAFTLAELHVGTMQADGFTHCRLCQYPDGSLDTNQLDEQGACVFGCGRKVDDDMGICPACQDHSANVVECEGCGVRYEKWNHTWQRMPA